jgi:hypothetical protein
MGDAVFFEADFLNRELKEQELEIFSLRFFSCVTGLSDRTKVYQPMDYCAV